MTLTAQTERRSDENDFDGNERRKMLFGLKYTSIAAISEIDDWLYDKCQGDFNLVIDETDDDMRRKTFKIMFQLEKDKTQFVEGYVNQT